MNDDIDLDLMRLALDGDEEACRMYLGSYTLVRPVDSPFLYRCKGDVPLGYVKVESVRGKSVYDKDGFLLSMFWILGRV